jgi:hypothetical protein
MIETNKHKNIQKKYNQLNNNAYVNIYKDGTTTKIEEGKTTETPSTQTPSQPTGGDISDGVRNAARTAGEDFLLNAGAGLASIAGAALGTAGIRNRKAIRNSISNFPSNAKNRLSSI